MTFPSKDRTNLEVVTPSLEEPIRQAPILLLSAAQVPPELVMVSESGSDAAEQYRLLAHALEKDHGGQTGRTIAVSSAVAGEGKTLTALNLAYALSETKTRQILLCDVDFCGGSITRTLGLGDPPGITDLFQESKPLNEILRRLDNNLMLLPAGTPLTHPLGLLRSAIWHQLMDSLRAHFHFIIMDCPPILGNEQMSVIDDVIDRVLLVVRAGYSRQETLKDALACVTPEKLAGFALNDVTDRGRVYRSYKRET
ncbi:MAG: AAA family ATPase [Pseudomonadota bacterium]